MMQDQATSTETIAAMCELLPNDPVQAVAQAVTAAAVVSISAGLSDERAVSGFRKALERVRKTNIGGGVQ